MPLSPQSCTVLAQNGPQRRAVAAPEQHPERDFDDRAFAQTLLERDLAQS